jgi:GntR family transcriptional regulator, transcriptional repressor for pyruvate dehydrogenase complex
MTDIIDRRRLAVALEATPVMRPREQVEMQIREAILSGQLRQGDKLPSETTLAEQFSVSRTTVREALRALAAAGLIAKFPGVAGGSFVQAADHRSVGAELGDSLQNVLRLGSISLEEVHAVRRLLEIPAAALAAERRAPDGLEQLERVLGREKGASVADPDVPELDISFHTAVAETAGNRTLAALISALHVAARPAARIELSQEVGRRTVSQHIAVVKAIKAGDGEAASKAMAEHLDYLARLPEG